jgi:error-prone DNA polymerase
MYVELQVTTNYSFLRGASHVEELFLAAAELGMPALGVTDRNSVAGIVRAHQRAQDTGVRLVAGCRLDLADGPSVLVYPMDRTAWSRLTRLLTQGKGRAGKGKCLLYWADLPEALQGMVVVLCSSPNEGNIRRLKAAFGGRAYVALTLMRRPNDAIRLRRIVTTARMLRVPTVATNDVLYHAPERRVLQDVLTCIREGSKIDLLGSSREETYTRQLEEPTEMARLFRAYPEALERTLEIADRCRFSVNDLCYQYPHEILVPGLTAQQTLEKLTQEAVPRRYPDGAPKAVADQLRHELALIASLRYAPYFLTVHSIVRFAETEGILCQGRGSAANSAVCYVLGITAIDPVRTGLLFERFISAERHEPPDIDVDFEHERREEVIQWIYKTYGRHRAALCATVIRYRGRGAIRDVGKAIGLGEDVISALSAQVWSWSEEGLDEQHAAALNLDLTDRRLMLALTLARSLIGFPRHMSQHPGGFVLTEDRLDDLVPIEPASMVDRQVIEWDKDDIDVLRFMKVDVLGLGMLGCMRRAFDLLSQHKEESHNLATIPSEDPATYAMIQKADTLGTFQIESRAQMSMLPRLKPKTFYDIVIQVAIVRPGPIQGDMVHPYLRRRDDKEKVDYPTPALKAVLEKTLGVPLFQEQAMQVAIVCAGFTPTEADALRRSMATFKVTGGVHHFKEKLINGMTERDYSREFAERTFSQIEGFGSYGFPESHAASFALIAYASAWMKCHHPDVFCCALLNSQPMGFYASAQIVRDAKLHGVEVRPVSINASEWDCTLEPSNKRFAVRLGMRMAKGVSQVDANAIIAQRGSGYQSIADMAQRLDVSVAVLERLAEADAFHAVGLARRPALWAVRGLSEIRLPLFDAITPEPAVSLSAMTMGRQVVEDYRSTGLSLRRHPVSFLRSDLTRRRIVSCEQLTHLSPGKRVEVAGIILVRQRPGSAHGVLFVTIEDETGHANLIVWPDVFEAQRRLLLTASMIACRGRLQREGEVIHIIADHMTDLSGLLRSVGSRDEFPLPFGRGDEARRGSQPDSREKSIVSSRDIHVLGSRPSKRERAIKVPTRDFR